MFPSLESVLALAAPPRCCACGSTSFARVQPFCRSCAVSVEPSDDAGAVYEFGGPVAEAIRRFKYEGQSDLALPLGAAFAEAASVWRGHVDAVVPVPLHWRRRRARGFDQAALLAKPVARALRVPVHLRTLGRVRHTPKQASLSRAQRRENVRGAFASRPLPDALRVLLVDDVRTTGATLEAAGSALCEAGAVEVHSMVLAVRLLDGPA